MQSLKKKVAYFLEQGRRRYGYYCWRTRWAYYRVRCLLGFHQRIPQYCLNPRVTLPDRCWVCEIDLPHYSPWYRKPFCRLGFHRKMLFEPKQTHAWPWRYRDDIYYCKDCEKIIRKRARVWSLLLCLLMLPACSPYEWKLRETNDYFTLLNDDHGYTQGLELSANDGRTTIGIGQDIYTPEHKRERIPRRDERPYAGYVYAFWERVDGDYSYTLRPGWIGPLARGKETQCTFHMAIGQDCPTGWPEQISDRPALEGSIRRSFDYEGIRLLYRIDAGWPKTRLLAASETRWKIGSDAEVTAGPRLEAVAHDELLDASESSVRKRRYRAAVELRFRWRAVTYFLATETSAIKESGDAYNYGGLEFTW